jgi:predicted TIM-barrel fold metal-dependent hydrolase
MKLAADEAANSGLDLQVHASIDLIAELGLMLAELPCIVVIDHLGRMNPSKETAEQHVDVLSQLIRTMRVYIKLSAFHRISCQPDYEDLAPVVRALAAAESSRLIWGSDWPHPQRPAKGKAVSADIDPYRLEDDGHCLNLLAKWLKDETIMRKVLVENPQDLFEF